MKKLPDKDVMHVISSVIIKLRYVIILLFILAGVYCALSISKTQVTDDFSYFLPDDCETNVAAKIYKGDDESDEETDESSSYDTSNAEIMVCNITYDAASSIADKIAKLDGVKEVEFDQTEAHYKGASALFSVTFNGDSQDENTIDVFNEVKGMLTNHDTYIDTSIGVDEVAQMISEIAGVVALAALVIAVIIILTSRSYFEVVIFAIVFSFAALLNMGTNYWLGTISTISNSVAVILQLALAIDYAIIFSHRYQDEALNFETTYDALVEALSKSIIEISSSSLTTISGLVALMLMQFKLGYDLGIVLSKGIVCSLVTVFLLMPALIMLFPKQIKRFAHKSLLPDFTPWGRILMKTRVLFVAIFAVILPFAVIFSSRAQYSFGMDSIDEIRVSESRTASRKISETFTQSEQIALLVPDGNVENEKAVLDEVSKMDKIKSALGLANIEVADGHYLADSFNARMLAELLDINTSEAEMLFVAYGVENEQYQVITNNISDYYVPLVDMFTYLFEKIDQGVVTLDEDSMTEINSLRSELEYAIAQLECDGYTCLVFIADSDDGGEEAYTLINDIRSVGEKYYGEGTCYTVSDITLAKDMEECFNSDSLKISLITIGAIFIILLITFKTVVGAAILVFVIQGSIWINFSCTYILNSHPFFVTYMIASSIQMGATIDYAIVLMNHYLNLKTEMPKRDAMARAVGESFPTIITSGSIMTIAGLLIAYMVSNIYIGHIGLAVGRGAAISVILVLSVLPQLIVICDKLIEKTTFKIGSPEVSFD